MIKLEELKERKNRLQEELKRITIKKHGSTPWAPGVLDQHKSQSCTFEEYTDPARAKMLKTQIADFDRQIDSYALNAHIERENEEQRIRESQQKYSYETGGKSQKTSNPAIAARYDARQRLYGMTKLQQVLAFRQRQKFKKLWLKAVDPNKKTQEEVAEQLGKLFK